MDYQIVVDSGCDIGKEHIEGENITLTHVPLNLQLENKVHLDDAAFNQDNYMTEMEATKVAVKTSAPSPSLFFDQFKAGEAIFGVTLSSKLSATYQSAITAKDMYVEEYGKKFIHIFDSLSASAGESAIALKISELIKNGLGTTEIVEQVNQFIAGMNTYFIIDKFDNLVKTGRVKPYIGKIASMLNIKPICGAENGEIKMLDKARGYTKALSRLTTIIKENTPDIETRIISITHVKALDKAMEMKTEFLKQFKPRDIIIQEGRGITTTYANRGGVVVAL